MPTRLGRERFRPIVTIAIYLATDCRLVPDFRGRELEPNQGIFRRNFTASRQSVM